MDFNYKNISYTQKLRDLQNYYQTSIKPQQFQTTI